MLEMEIQFCQNLKQMKNKKMFDVNFFSAVNIIDAAKN
jgi:hypothetical protein